MAATAFFEDLANRAATNNPFYHCSLISVLVIVSFFQDDLARSSNEAMRLEGLVQTGGSEFSHGLSIYFRTFSDLHRGDFEADVLKSLALAGIGREDEALECLAAADRLFKICSEPDSGRQCARNQGLHGGDPGIRPRAGL